MKFIKPFTEVFTCFQKIPKRVAPDVIAHIHPLLIIPIIVSLPNNNSFTWEDISFILYGSVCAFFGVGVERLRN